MWVVRLRLEHVGEGVLVVDTQAFLLLQLDVSLYFLVFNQLAEAKVLLHELHLVAG